jgi:hypothetical protein
VRKRRIPKLQAAGWDNDPHSIAEQRWFTLGRIVVHGNQATRRRGKRADYLLRYTRDFPIAVVEAKADYKKAADGLQQAKEYGGILSLRFAYATNGQEIIEFDFITGLEREMSDFPTPAELWSRLRAAEKLTDDDLVRCLPTPFNLTSGKIPHYYQEIVIHRVVQAILQGKRRVVVTMATGTGKTVVAFHICWILWSCKSNAKGDPRAGVRGKRALVRRRIGVWAQTPGERPGPYGFDPFTISSLRLCRRLLTGQKLLVLRISDRAVPECANLSRYTSCVLSLGSSLFSVELGGGTASPTARSSPQSHRSPTGASP